MQWIVATFTNEPEKLARFAGLGKGILAGGLASSFGTEAAGLAQRKVVAYCFSIQAFGLVCMCFVTWKCVTATNYSKEERVASPSPPEQPIEKEQNIEKSDGV